MSRKDCKSAYTSPITKVNTLQTFTLTDEAITSLMWSKRQLPSGSISAIQEYSNIDVSLPWIIHRKLELLLCI